MKIKEGKTHYSPIVSVFPLLCQAKMGKKNCQMLFVPNILKLSAKRLAIAAGKLNTAHKM